MKPQQLLSAAANPGSEPAYYAVAAKPQLAVYQFGTEAAREYVRTKATQQQIDGDFAAFEDRFPGAPADMVTDIIEVCSSANGPCAP